MARTVDPEGIPRELELAETLLDNGELDEAQDVVDAVLLAGPQGDDEVHAYYLRGEILLERRKARNAILAFEAAEAGAPGDPHILAGLADAYFQLWQFPKAQKAYEAALRSDPRLGRAQRGMALCLDRAGKRKLAEMHFQRAFEIDPESYPLPVRVDRAEFDRVAREAIESIPAEIKERLGPIGFLVEDYPALAMLGERPDDADPQSLGVFYGDSIPEHYERSALQFVPNHIHLFQRNLEQLAATREDLEEEIRITVFHEVGHYLGYDEDGLDELGLG